MNTLIDSRCYTKIKDKPINKLLETVKKKVLFILKTVVSMKVIGILKKKDMVLELINGKMVLSIKDIGKKTKLVAMVS